MTKLAVTAALLALGASGCLIGTWRMHPGADMARLEDVCTTVPVCTGDTCTCEGTTESIAEPSPVAWSVGVLAGRETSTIGAADSPAISFEADGELSYVLPGDRLGVGLQATYLRDLMNAPDGKNLDAVAGWGGSLLVHYAPTPRIVLHVGAGALDATYILGQGTSSEADSGAQLGLRGLAGATIMIARNERRDFFFTAQAAYLHLPDAMVGGRALGYGDVTITAALGLGLAP